jgi:predicted secreted protein
MAKEFGKDWRIKVGDGQNAETFQFIGGEVSFDWSRSSKEIDTSTKDDGSYATAGYGRQSVTIAANGKLSLPDEGFERLADVAKSPTPVLTIEICKGAIVKFKGAMAVGNLSTTFPDDDACTWKVDFKAAAAPAIDDLGATV